MKTIATLGMDLNICAIVDKNKLNTKKYVFRLYLHEKKKFKNNQMRMHADYFYSIRSCRLLENNYNIE